MEDPIPLGKLVRNLEALGDRKPREVMVLLSTGALNPVHRRHVAAFDIACAALSRDHGVEVVAGFLSPSHDRYVQGKLGKRLAIPGEHRMAMLELATRGHPLLSPMSWELKQRRFVDFPYVAHALEERIARELPEARVRVGYLCGTDHVSKCNLYAGVSSTVPVVAVGRAGHERGMSGRLRPPKAYYVAEASLEADVSSTDVRARLMAGKAVSELLAPDVEAYLFEHALLGAVRPEASDPSAAGEAAPVASAPAGGAGGGAGGGASEGAGEGAGEGTGGHGVIVEEGEDEVGHVEPARGAAAGACGVA